jgi:hypothetical protein
MFVLGICSISLIEREREKKVEGVVRDTTVLEGGVTEA